ncbi:MAG: S8 family peptidase [Eubacteriales bacterium]
MNNNFSIQDFIYSPDTVDFIIRENEYLPDYILQNPNVLLTQTLAGGFVIGYANVNVFENILNTFRTGLASSLSIVLGTLDRPALESAGIAQMHTQPFYNLGGKGVLIGIVDTGIDYTQNIFINDDGTSKIQYIYDQSISSIPPEGFYMGTEYNNAQINGALSAANPYELVPQQDTSGHGTFLASIAAGRALDGFTGAAPEAELIVVKLKKARPYYLDFYNVPEDQDDAYESSAVMIGVEYILQKARQLNRPVALCIGLGSNFGSHDGFTLFEEYLRYISSLKGVALTVAAGNESQARHNMFGLIPATGETNNIDLSVGGGAGDINISIWNGVSDRLSVAVISPLGEVLGRFTAVPGQRNESNLLFSQTRIQVEYLFPMDGNGKQLTVIRLIDATPGIWTITVYGDIIIDGTFHAWLPITGFVAPDVEFLSSNPYNTITVPGTMIGGICCGAYDSRNNTLYADTSWGPTLTPLTAPDFTAPGVEVNGFYPGNGTFPSGYGSMSGTSVAAAITTGACALFLEWGIVDRNDVTLSTNQIRAYLIRGCSRSESQTYPSYKWGYGSLNLLRSFQIMRGI